MSEPIDFEKDFDALGVKNNRVHWLNYLKWVAARVERETIERCAEILVPTDEMNERVMALPRLYSPAPSDAAKGDK